MWKRSAAVAASAESFDNCQSSSPYRPSFGFCFPAPILVDKEKHGDGIAAGLALITILVYLLDEES